MIGCSFGRNFQVTVAGGSYQEGLVSVIQGVPTGMLITEEEIYGDLLLRKPGADELSSPRKEPDLPIIYTGVNAADTIEGANNAFLTNGTPFTILIPNLDRHFIHIKQYQDTNRTPRPGHASYASFIKYGPCDDAIGAGIFSGRYTSTIVAAGYIAKRVLSKFGIKVFSYVKELAGVECPVIDSKKIYNYTENYKKMRRDYDPFYQEVYTRGRVKNDMRFLEKVAIFAEIEKEIDTIRAKQKKMDKDEIKEKYAVHYIVNCPDITVADEMVKACMKICSQGDSAGGIVEVIATGLPAGLGEPVFYKLDAELGRLLGIGAVKGVEVGAGFKVKDMTGYESNDRMHSENGKVIFDSNNAGGITGGLSTGQDVIIRLAVKGTPTIAKPQNTIDKYTLENKELAAITRRDPTIVARVWPVAENFTAIILLDHLFAHLGYQKIREVVENGEKI
ncbi:MAG TPA: chorismate synthase [Victivallales bacterium]|nr:chorismate synthase [Victivallales bacterium]HPO90713.1 chorismate synthase [Victivallales bacterium]HRR29104.1 chorismate synthase [Victivallales bacterium]HRU00318.1 chorismate synthase [Victivallales bacterium]